MELERRGGKTVRRKYRKKRNKAQSSKGERMKMMRRRRKQNEVKYVEYGWSLLFYLNSDTNNCCQCVELHLLTWGLELGLSLGSLSRRFNYQSDFMEDQIYGLAESDCNAAPLSWICTAPTQYRSCHR